ncbi:MAG: hypothetical protein R3D69_10755 [Xanthobacteraceae bacterium]
MRATRRLDQLRQAQKETVGLSTGVKMAGTVSAGLPITHRDERPTLASQGIDKNLAHQARTLGALSEEKFERAVSDARTAVRQAVKTVVRGAAGTGDEWQSIDSAFCRTSLHFSNLSLDRSHALATSHLRRRSIC